MPKTSVVFFRDVNGTAPTLLWLNALKKSDKKSWARCVARIGRLVEAGFELRRPEADILQDGIYELRTRSGYVQYRLLYFFHGRNIAVLCHGIIKEGAAVPKIELERAIRRRKIFESDPDYHTYQQSEEA